LPSSSVACLLCFMTRVFCHGTTESRLLSHHSMYD
jgi:hypothetical protein